ncbi:MAG: conjugal transfer protein TraX [Bifidobacteriaceae bacterium]|jgi:hypothetical protein|nr:conjugal transfer protein TraX [Bifidobacteriaceae bacterium]
MMEQPRPKRAKWRGLSRQQLKIIGLVLLIGSMFGTAVIQKGMPADLSEVDFGRLSAAILLEAASWMAIPLYSWMLVTGLEHTRSVGRYALRLAVLAVIAEVPYDLATSGRVWDLTSQNPVFALLVTLVVLAYAKAGSGARPGGRLALSAGLALAGGLWIWLFNVGLRLNIMPAGVLILVFGLIFWFGRRRQNTMMLLGCLIGVVAGLTPALGLVLVHFRRGEEELRQGASRRYIFYSLYPVCLMVAGLYRILPS